MTTAAEVQALFGPRHSVAMRQVQLDPVTAFTCWNILATVLDQLTDIRACITAGELPVASVIDFVGHMPEDLLAFVMSQIDPINPKQEV